MIKAYHLPVKKILLLMGVMLALTQAGRSQSVYAPYSYEFYQKFNADVYNVNNSFHTSLKPYLIDSIIAPRYNAITSIGVDSSRKNYFLRKIFNEHVFDERTSEYTFYADYIADLQAGKDFANHTTTYLNTRGYQLGGTIGDKFSFYTSGYEDQARFAPYYQNVVEQIGFVPGEAYNRYYQTKTEADWSYVTAIISYTPVKNHLNITLGEDKTFIGDGYRSLLLSDFAANYPLLRVTATLGRVQYMMMWANLEDLNVPKYDTYGNNRRKWAAFHYVDWNVTNRFSVGYFNAMIAAEADDNGSSHGFDANYINPLVFAASLGPKTPYPDNVLTGFTAKYKVLNKTTIYAQLLLDRVSESAAPKNTGGYQIGIRGADLFNITNFNYLFEYNTVKPYTYSSPQVITNYTDYSEPLGDPLGANFKEAIAILDYSIGRFSLQGQVNYASFGLDPTNTSLNYGQDLMLAFDPSTVEGSNTGQGIPTHLYYGEGTIAYLINPKYNLRFELGGLYRRQENSQGTQNTKLVTFGIRASFRQLYHDF